MDMQDAVQRLWKKIGALLAVISLEVAVSWLVFMGCALLFLWMADVVFLEQERDFDQAAFAFARDYTNPRMTRVMYFITFFASKSFLIYGSLGLALLFLLFRRWRFYSIHVIAVAATTTLFNQSMKFFFNRPRPATAFLEQSGNSFPSGHAMIGGAFWGLMGYLLWTNVQRTWLRWLLCGLLGVWVFLIGFSRVYLNVHYATDVLAGWGAGFFWLIIALALLKRLQHRLGRKVERQMEGEAQ